MDSDRPCCMICMESEGALYRSPCNCTGILVHAECFERMIQSPNYRSNCAVCKAPYGAAVEAITQKIPRCLSLPEMIAVVTVWFVLGINVVSASYVTYIAFANATDINVESTWRGPMLLICVFLWMPPLIWLSLGSHATSCVRFIVHKRYSVNVSEMSMV